MEGRPDRFTAFFDADVLVGELQRDFLLRLAAAGFYRGRWTTRVLDEMHKVLVGRVGEDRATYVRDRMTSHFDECLISGWERLETSLHDWPDPDDAHVVAGAVRARAAVIVTNNLKDFPADRLAEFEMEALSADEFLADAIDLDQRRAVDVIASMRRGRTRPLAEPDEFVDLVRARSMPLTADLLAQWVGDL